MIRTLTSASTRVGVEARAELGNILNKNFFDLRSGNRRNKSRLLGGWLAGWFNDYSANPGSILQAGTCQILS